MAWYRQSESLLARDGLARELAGGASGEDGLAEGPPRRRPRRRQIDRRQGAGGPPHRLFALRPAPRGGAVRRSGAGRGGRLRHWRTSPLSAGPSRDRRRGARDSRSSVTTAARWRDRSARSEAPRRRERRARRGSAGRGPLARGIEAEQRIDRGVHEAGVHAGRQVEGGGGGEAVGQQGPGVPEQVPVPAGPVLPRVAPVDGGVRARAAGASASVSSAAAAARARRKSPSRSRRSAQSPARSGRPRAARPRPAPPRRTPRSGRAPPSRARPEVDLPAPRIVRFLVIPAEKNSTLASSSRSSGRAASKGPAQRPEGVAGRDGEVARQGQRGQVRVELEGTRLDLPVERGGHRSGSTPACARSGRDSGAPIRRAGWDGTGCRAWPASGPCPSRAPQRDGGAPTGRSPGCPDYASASWPAGEMVAGLLAPAPLT